MRLSCRRYYRVVRVHGPCGHAPSDYFSPQGWASQFVGTQAPLVLPLAMRHVAFEPQSDVALQMPEQKPFVPPETIDVQSVAWPFPEQSDDFAQYLPTPNSLPCRPGAQHDEPVPPPGTATHAPWMHWRDAQRSFALSPAHALPPEPQ